MTVVAAVSFEPRIGDLASNRRRGADAIGAAVGAGAEVIVLPELSTSGYVFDSSSEAAAVAIERDHPLLLEWGEVARAGQAVLVAGFCERGPDGMLYNSALLVDGGHRFVYRKVHLWDREKLVFCQGSEPPAVCETSAGRIAVVVCYDLEFPEMTRGLALAGAELIAVPTNWPLVERPPGERPPEVVAAMAAARSSHVYIACADRSGIERDVQFTGGTSIVSCDGWVINSTTAEGLALADIDLTVARNKALGPLNDVLSDRRPHIYAALPDQRPEVPEHA